MGDTVFWQCLFGGKIESPVVASGEGIYDD